MKGYSLLLPLVFAMNMVQAQTPPDVEKLPHTVKSPHGESSVYAAWRAQYLRRLARPQCLRRLAASLMEQQRFLPLILFWSCTRLALNFTPITQRF